MTSPLAGSRSTHPGGSDDPLELHNTSSRMRKAWHVVALATEVTDEPVQVWLLGEPWVLVRLDGGLRAFPDRCPHRLAPLSAGTVVGAELQCGYHGWRFAPDGVCTAIPALGKEGNVSKRATLRAAAGLQERYGLVWLAPEEPLAPLPEFPEWGADGFELAMSTLVRTPVSAAQLVDNFLDASHFPFVHAETFGVPEAATVVEPGIDRRGWEVETTFSTWYRSLDDPLVETGEREAVQPQDLLKRGGASYTVYLRLQFPATGWTTSILFACQPESAATTRVYKLLARDDLGGDLQRLHTFVKDEDQILVEDLAILERYPHRMIHLDRKVEMHTRADRLSLAWRDLVAEMPCD
jgi:phenylpropionate dioxygenase-like ring-hydroxylating dioxygenase large terminal subunit